MRACAFPVPSRTSVGRPRAKYHRASDQPKTILFAPFIVSRATHTHALDRVGKPSHPVPVHDGCDESR